MKLIHFVLDLSITGNYSVTYSYVLSQNGKLDQFCEEQNLLCGNNVESYEDLIALKEDKEKESLELIELRKSLRNELKRVKRSGNEEREAEIKGQIKDVSARLHKLKCHHNKLLHSIMMQANLYGN